MRIALGIEYNGAGFSGWQKQQNRLTIQDELQKALSKVANESIFLFCAGRTDANVHATGQVVHFDTHAKRHIDAWIWGSNSYLPNTIVVRWAQMVDYRFHARFSALSRRYRYIIYNNPIRPALGTDRLTWHYYYLNSERMQLAANYLLGEQNFNSFRSSQCNSKTAMREVKEVRVWREQDYVIFEIEANAFLHHMVRNIAGVLIKIGCGYKEPEWMLEVLAAKNRRSAAETSPPNGLYLTQVTYPSQYSFPQNPHPFLL